MPLNDMPPRSGPPFPKDRWRPDTGWQTRWATSAPSGSCRLHARTTLGRRRAAVEHPNAELESLRSQSDPDSADSGRWRRESEGVRHGWTLEARPNDTRQPPRLLNVIVVFIGKVPRRTRAPISRQAATPAGGRRPRAPISRQAATPAGGRRPSQPAAAQLT